MMLFYSLKSFLTKESCINRVITTGGKLLVTDVYRLKKNIGVFGSNAKGEATDKSDIDIAVEINGVMGLIFIEMADEIEALFGIKTEVIPKRSIKPEYFHQVEKEIVYA